jgi:hypothetical protein
MTQKLLFCSEKIRHESLRLSFLQFSLIFPSFIPFTGLFLLSVTLPLLFPSHVASASVFLFNCEVEFPFDTTLTG